MQNLSGKTIVISGASSGIGRECARMANQQGAQVVLLGRDEQRLQQTIDILPFPEMARPYAFDLRDEEACERVAKEIAAHLGRIHGMIHAAGISATIPFKVANAARWTEFWETNVLSVVQLTKAFTKTGRFDAEGGSIVVLASVMSLTGEMGKSLYSTSKSALVGLVRSLALEFASKKIRVNAVSPGVVRTPMIEQQAYFQDPESLQKMIDLHPLGLGEPQDVASLCCFLLSDAARWISGANIPIDGGYTAR